MTESDNGTTPVLAELAAAEGDPDLFPDEVRRLHEQGAPLKARKVLLARAKVEPRAERARKQRQYAADLRLWAQRIKSAPSLTTLNGIGTRLYGKHQAARDGRHIATLWFTVVFLPIWPIASYLVAPGERSGSWLFFGRTPLSPVARGARSVATALALVAAGALGANLVWDARHIDVHVINGFDVPVVVRVAGEERPLQPRQTTEFVGVSTKGVELAARLKEDGKEIERFTRDLPGSGTVIYNVAGRAVLSLDYVRYGVGKPPAGRLLPGDRVLTLEHVDYPFQAPPASKSVEEGKFIQSSQIEAIDGGVPAVNVVVHLLGEARGSQAVSVARAELFVHPEEVSVATLAAYSLIAEDRAGAIALVRGCRDRAPDVVDLHRLFQELTPYPERASVQAEYRRLSAEHPGSAQYHYLVGRTLDDGDEAMEHFRQALQIDPEFDYAYLAMGYQLALVGRLQEAERYYAEYAARGDEQAQRARPERVRLARIVGKPMTEALGLARNPASEGFDELAASLRAAQRPGDLDALLEACCSAPAAGAGGAASPVDPADLLYPKASLALAAGRLDVAREAIGGLQKAGRPTLESSLRLAFSQGAAPGDRVQAHMQLARAPSLGTMAESHQLLALALAEADGWKERASLMALLEATDLAPICAFLAEPSPSRLAAARAALPRLGLQTRWAAELALAERLATTSPDEARALRHEAARIGLPSELPFLGGA